ncbi:hepatoma-derived growth factor-related protein 2-like [Fopius arisanus]|uniref:Hepatoma-derived growth factor-related protein 2-like n=1 Tax=Fopius arisanus TaxID=64838 RepID=A0A9R1T3Z2_9HYME|nr:PREDICTED: hepatoma-derived growth factor-related protein 2-like [Fopius arisanus]
MTRFARAKGSKASNERLPDEPTPWHVMKQQLEDSVTSKQSSPAQRTKSAKELLKEREEPFYGDLGAVSHDWADFQPEKSKSSVKKSSNDSSATPVSKKIKKKELKSTLKNTDVTEVPVNPENSSSPKKSKKRKSNAELNSSEALEAPAAPGNPPPKNKKQKINEEEGSASPEKSQQKKNKKKDKSTAPVDIKPQESTKNSSSDLQNGDASEKTSGKLSKRQKRNRKNKMKSEVSEGKEDNKKVPGAFNTEGNEWSTEIKISSKQKTLGSPQEENQSPEDIKQENKPQMRNPPFYQRREGFSKPLGRFDSQKVVKKRKPPKIRDDKEHKRRKPTPGSSKVIINGMEIEIVMYDGFPVKKEDAERLEELKSQMVMKGIPKSEINAAMKLERRKAEKALTRVKKNVCFHCRKAGHNLSDCPELGREEVVTGICFKCGSTEHTHFECKVTKKEEFGFAKCFICREQGHIAKQCPDNPKGLYPQGGACKICGDVTHLKKDCPDLVQEKEDSILTLGTISETVEDLEGEGKAEKSIKPKQKVVTF